MNKTILNLKLKPMDRLVIPKSSLKIIQHHALYLGEDIYGQSWIIENKYGHGVRIITAQEFFKDTPEITRIIPFIGDNIKRKHAVQRALLSVGQPYDLINYNCESFANHVQLNIIKSGQATIGGILFLIFLGFIVKAIGNNN